MYSEISAFGEILLYIVGAAVLVMVTMFASWLIRPDRPNSEKLTTYECGEDPVGTAWGRFNMRFYIVALMFILFDVEIVFLFPWAVVFGNEQLILETDGLWAYLSIFEMFMFIIILALGLVYVWAKGWLDWEKPAVELTKVNSKVPQQLYEEVNKKY